MILVKLVGFYGVPGSVVLTVNEYVYFYIKITLLIIHCYQLHFIDDEPKAHVVISLNLDIL